MKNHMLSVLALGSVALMLQACQGQVASVTTPDALPNLNHGQSSPMASTVKVTFSTSGMKVQYLTSDIQELLVGIYREGTSFATGGIYQKDGAAATSVSNALPTALSAGLMAEIRGIVGDTGSVNNGYMIRHLTTGFTTTNQTVNFYNIPDNTGYKYFVAAVKNGVTIGRNVQSFTVAPELRVGPPGFSSIPLTATFTLDPDPTVNTTTTINNNPHHPGFQLTD